MLKSNRVKRREVARRVARWLVEHWPKAFKRPLKIGVHHDILGTPFSAEELSYGLRLVTGRERYLKRLVAGATRYDLDGQPAGEVTPEAAAHAAKRLLVLEAKRLRRAQEQERLQQPKKPKPSKRLLAAVAALKAAGRARVRP